MRVFIEVCGWLAFVLILGSYLLLSIGKMQSRSSVYQWMNLVGGVCFVINCSWNGAWPSVALNFIWAGIALYALRRNARSGTRAD
ncbi:MAG TPA: hypothetical protein VHV81_14545 [Steroidobacteraceae bacterium]|jgi:hypothetical protein|nr:hypothetical protein [Steroidobacteraceae bacterium]